MTTKKRRRKTTKRAKESRRIKQIQLLTPTGRRTESIKTGNKGRLRANKHSNRNAQR